MEWQTLLKNLAPSVGTALLGPLGGAAATFVAEKLGLEDSTVEAVTAALSKGNLTPEQLERVKLADIDFQKFLEKNKIDLEVLHAGDRKDARGLLALTRSKMPALLSLFVTVGFFGILGGMLSGALRVSDSQALLLMLGSLSTAWGMVMAFWFGTTSDSGRKTEMLAGNMQAK